jgi:hypothetical protein
MCTFEVLSTLIMLCTKMISHSKGKLPWLRKVHPCVVQGGVLLETEVWWNNIQGC